MSDLLVDDLVSKATNWRQFRDQEHGQRWREYYRAWRGEWTREEKNRESEQSQIIMPSTAHAIDSAVSEVIEALFSKEQWIDTGNPLLDDLLLSDLWVDRPHIEEAILLGALYGNIVSKIDVSFDGNTPKLTTQALSPTELIVDPAANSFDESLGIVHHLFVPKHVVYRGMEEGKYRSVNLDQSPNYVIRNENEAQPRDTDYVEIHEWWGLLPVSEVEDRQTKDQLSDDAIGPDNLVEAVCTIANEDVVLRCEANPFGSDRPFVSAQWHTVPRRIWGRGIAEMAYWPQKALDAEMRARIDALAFSTVPMMAVSTRQVPRSERFFARPGRNIPVRGDARTALQPISFGGPDPGTYQQSIELQRTIEVATGQITAASPIGDVSRTGSGPLSAILGASVKRSARTLMNIERDYIVPLIEKAAVRLNALDPSRYPRLENRPKINSGIGIMIRELENQQLAQLMTQLPSGAAQLSILRLIVEGSAIREKSDVLSIVDQLVEQAMAPDQLTPDQELVMAQLQEQQATREQRSRETLAELRIKQEEAETERLKVEQLHQRELLDLGIKAEKASAEREQSLAIREFNESQTTQ
jgi:hypothetical protein